MKVNIRGPVKNKYKYVGLTITQKMFENKFIVQ